MGAGSELRQARERVGLSAEQVAERTKIQLHKIETLENDSFEGLPGGIYLDGIVRAYAREVAIDPEPLIERMRRERAMVAKDLSEQAPDKGGPERLFIDLSSVAIPPAWRDDSAPAPAPTPVDIDILDRSRAIEPPAKTLIQQEAIEPPLWEDTSEAAAPRYERYEPVRPAHGYRRLALPLVTLLAIAGWAAYFHETIRPFDREGTAVTSTPPRTPEPTETYATTVDAPAPPDTARQDRADDQTVASTNSPGVTTTPPPPQPAPADAPPPSPRDRAAAPSPPPPAAAPTTVERNETPPVRNVSGAWALTTRVDSSSYARYAGLHLGYEIQLAQAGNRVTGSGVKVTENGSGIGSRAQTPVLVAGTIDGDRLTLAFTERGARRPTQGKFVLLLDEGGTLRGRFSSNAARSSGTVEAHRVSR